MVQKGTAATLDFAAVTAQAARIYKNFPAVYPGLADSCLKASQKAWKWALKNPNLSYDQFQMNKLYQPEISDKVVEPVPGLLSGGPNPGAAQADGQYYEFTEPETAFADVEGSYASNEIAINWNAPAVYLLNAVEAERFYYLYFYFENQNYYCIFASNFIDQ